MYAPSLFTGSYHGFTFTPHHGFTKADECCRPRSTKGKKKTSMKVVVKITRAGFYKRTHDELVNILKIVVKVMSAQYNISGTLYPIIFILHISVVKFPIELC